MTSCVEHSGSVAVLDTLCRVLDEKERSMAKSAPQAEKLSDLVWAVLRATGESMTAFASRCHMSQRMMARYAHGTHFPPPSRALALLRAARGVPPDLYHRFGEALRVPVADRLPPIVPAVVVPDAAGESAAMLLALFTAAEDNGVAPQATRKIALAALVHARARGLDVATAERIVAGLIERSGGGARR
jgi:MoxR-like ATPase